MKLTNKQIKSLYKIGQKYKLSDDNVQDAILIILSSNYNVTNLNSYFYTIAKNLEKNGKKMASRFEALNEEFEVACNIDGDIDTDYWLQVIRNYLTVYANDKERFIFDMRIINTSYEDIADMVGDSVANIKKIQKKNLNLIKKNIKITC